MFRTEDKEGIDAEREECIVDVARSLAAVLDRSMRGVNPCCVKTQATF